MTGVRSQPSVLAHLLGLVTLVVLGSAILVWVAGDMQRGKPPAGRVLSWKAAVANIDRMDPTEFRKRGVETRPEAPPGSRPLPRMARQLGRAPNEVVLANGTVWVHARGRHPGWIAVDHDPRWGPPPRTRWAVWLVIAAGALLGALWVARRLVGPLAALEKAAPALATGQDFALPASAPREIASLALALDRARQAAAVAARERAVLLAGVSHDLRTPLARLKFGAELLGNHPTDQQLKDDLNRDVDEIDAIVGQFIDYARDGRDEKRTQVDLALLAREVLAAEASDDWAVTVPEQALMMGFPLALRRALLNLVRNAQTHGQAPRALRLEQTAGNAWTLTVSNGGPRLSEAEKRAAVEPFVRGTGSGGSGLGLAIVARVATQHRATLEIRDSVPEGVTVVLAFPRK